MKPRFFRTSALSTVIFAGVFATSQAATLFWDGAGTDDNWSTVNNWGTSALNSTTNPGSFPGSADDVVFYSTDGARLTTNVVNQAFTLQSLTIGNSRSGAVAIGGSSVITLNGKLNYDPSIFNSGSASGLTTPTTLNTGIYVQSLTGGTTISAPITLGSAQQWVNNSNSNALIIQTGALSNGANNLTIGGTGPTTISSTFTGGGSGGLTKVGAGVLTLSGGAANTYTGLTTVSAGTLQLGKTAGINAIAGNILINAATLRNTESNQIADTATVTFDNATSAKWEINGKSETIATLDMTNAPSGGENGLVTGVAGNLTVTGILTKSAGGITLNGTSSGSSTITVGTLINTGGDWTFGSGGGSAQSLVIGSGGLTIGGGSTILANGGLNFISLGGNVTSQTNAATNTISGSGQTRLNATRTFDVADGGAAIDLAISTIIADGTGAGGITKTGVGTMTLTGVNTYTGATTINGGILAIGTSGTIANTATNAININNTGTLSMGRSDTWGIVVLNPITIGAGGSMTNSGAFFNTLGALALNGGTLTSTAGREIAFGSWALAGTVTVGGSAASTISQAGTNAQINLGAGTVTGTTFNVADATSSSSADLTISATLQNGRSAGGTEQPSSLTKSGVGTMVLSAANTYTGGTSVTAGKLIAQSSNTALGTAAVSVGASGTLQINHIIAAASDYAFANAITGAGTLEFASSTAPATSARRLSTVGSLAGFTGNISVLDNGNYLASTASTNQNLSIASGGYVTMSINNGFGKLDGAGIVMRDNAGGSVNLTLGNNNATGGDFSGTIIAPGLFNSMGDIALVKVGTGTQTLSGSNTYAGGTSIKAGTIALVGGNNRLATTGSVTLGDAGTTGKLVLGNATAASNQTLAGLLTTGLGGSVVGAHSTTNSVLTLDIATSNSFGGTLGGGGTNENKLALTKAGAGDLTLSGTNTYTGDTLVSAGSLYVTGSLAGNVAVDSNATLGGGGTVANVSFDGGAKFDIVQALANPLDASAISFATTGFGIDNLVSGGAAIDWGTITDGIYTLINGNLNETNLGNFGFANAVSIGGNRKAYFAEGSLQLVVVPEPGTALLAALGMIALLRRRRD